MGSRKSNSPVIVKEISENAKTGQMSATYANQSTCGDCRLKNNGCYANIGNTNIHAKRLNESPISDPIEVAREEAAGIEKLSGRFPLRLHVVGDAPNNESAKILAKAAEKFMAKHGNIAYTYTHQWKKVSRKSWGKVSILASCESIAEVKQAKKKGWISSLIVQKFENGDKAYVKNGVKIVPCPAQTRKGKVQCIDCKLCMKEDNLRKANITIGFEPDFLTHKMIGNTLFPIL